MAIMRDKPGVAWLPIAVVAVAAVGGGVWWMQGHDDAGPKPVAAQAASEAASSGSAYEALMNPPAPPSAPTMASEATPEQQREAHAVLEEQVKTAQKLEQPEVWKPLTGAVRERPAFASAMEWDMLKGVANNQADPQAELLRMTNFLRYTKLLEKWQDMPAGGNPAMRQALALQLSSELAQHVANGEVDSTEALRQAPALLRDAYADAKARSKAERDLTAAIQQATEAAKAK